MAFVKATTKVICLQKLLAKLEFEQKDLITIYSDSQSAVALNENPKYHLKASMLIPTTILLKKRFLKKNSCQIYSYFIHDNKYLNKIPTSRKSLFVHGVWYVQITGDHFKTSCFDS
jgi:hypothetical protein